MVTTMQMTMFDPREAPTATAEMLADQGLRDAIAAMRDHAGREEFGCWPFVENIGDAAQRAWAVDDGGVRYVVVGELVFEMGDLCLANHKIRDAAKDAFARLDTRVEA